MPAKNHLSLEQKQILLKALKESENPYIRDLFLWNSLGKDGCDEIDYDQYGMLIMTKTEGCWENVHPDLL